VRRDGLTRSEIQGALSSGKRLVGARVVLFVTPAPGEVRAAFVAGRRVGGAVQRNRVRRVMREAWRRVAPSVRAGTGVVVMARKGFLPARTQELETEMRQSLTAASLVDA
jgi:ribonuclease P protein component